MVSTLVCARLMLRIRNTNAPSLVGARLWAEIDLDAVRYNVAQLRARLRPGSEITAIVKADGYGHDAVQVARCALAAGASALGVANVVEGMELRDAGITARITLVGPSVPSDAELLVRYRIEPTVADLALAEALQAQATGWVDVQIEVDTGMARHGVSAGAAADFVRSLRVFPNLRIVGVFTHFAGLDVAARPSMMLQLLLFRAALQQMGMDQVKVHASNTFATCLLPEAHFDAVRIGGGLYGFDQGAPGLGTRPAMTLKSKIVGLRPVATGDTVGYGGMWLAPKATILALLPCGYADGLVRANWNGAPVLVRGKRGSVVGNVSMNQMVVDVGAIAGAAIGDEVVLLGKQGDDRLRPEDRVLPGGSAYEITSLLRRDLPRIFRASSLLALRESAAIEIE
ncbi:alanine racemase [Planctomycetota bacterium]|nr:alanine racemase [Planctomycetota bacterium]